MNRVFDACVVGSGAAGAVAARELAERGWDIAIIEQGRDVPPGTNLQPLLASHEPCLARDATGRWVRDGYPWTACVVGGGTRFFAGISFRLRPVDFDATAHTAPDALDPRWPFRYEELRSEYDEIEHLLGVARAVHADPTEPAAGPPKLPPHVPSRRGQLIAAAAERLGFTPFPTPLAVRSTATRDGPACANLTHCTDIACPVNAKGDVATIILSRLRVRPNVTLAPRVRALRLEETRRGRVTALDCVDLVRNQRIVVRARRYVLAANAIQTAALLLRSASRWSPDGLGNRSGLVGRGLCLKVARFVKGRSEQAPPSPEDDQREERLQGRYSTVAISDCYLDPSCPAGMGGMIYEANPWTPQPPGKGVLLRLECLLADQPMASNRVRLGRSRDRHGLRTLVLDYRPHPLDLRRLDHVTGQAEEILRTGGVKRIEREPLDFMLGSCHLHGTCRAGGEPTASVVDAFGRVHDADGVFVADGGFMPFPGGVNPTLTIQANALRVARAMPAADDAG